MAGRILDRAHDVAHGTVCMTHRQWHNKVTRLLALSERDPTQASRGFHRLARAVETDLKRGLHDRLCIETDLKRGLHDWHLMQSLSLASLAEAANDDHRAAARTLRRVVDHQRVLLVGEQRAYVSACAAAAIEFAKAGDLRAARRTIQAAEPWARRRRPPEQLLRQARALVRSRSRSPAVR
jgi:hypothetical protein